MNLVTIVLSMPQRASVPLSVLGMLISVVLLALTQPPPVEPPEQTAARLSRSSPALADTLRRTVTAGQTLIVNLPDSLGDRPVQSYTIQQPPALSRLVERSWVWRTKPADAGRHLIHAEARFRSEPTDTLVVEVNVE